VLSTLLDYSYGFLVASPKRRKAKLFLWLSIINNLGILAVFKYYNFFALQFQQGFELLGWHTHPVLLDLALPIGISFYTFHGMSYVFDIYRGKMQPVKNIVDYGLFVSFFPLLVAGPIDLGSKPEYFQYKQGLVSDPFNWQKIKRSAKNFYFIYSENDPYDCGSHHGRQLTKLLGGELILMKDEGHCGLSVTRPSA
jgi:D-alanyl-lipoteichoic acid acyltransferase DltB (MBOAT superfamily)